MVYRERFYVSILYYKDWSEKEVFLDCTLGKNCIKRILNFTIIFKIFINYLVMDFWYHQESAQNEWLFFFCHIRLVCIVKMHQVKLEHQLFTSAEPTSSGFRPPTFVCVSQKNPLKVKLQKGLHPPYLLPSLYWSHSKALSMIL